MKKLTSTLALASVLFFASCEKDEVQPKPTTTPAAKTQIELLQDGSWDFESNRFIIKYDGLVVSDETETFPGKVTFLANNTVIFASADENDTSNYSFQGQTIVIDDLTFKITTLTESKLVMENEESETDPDDGTVISFTSILSLKK